MVFLLVGGIIFSGVIKNQPDNLYRSLQGEIFFRSEAPLEIIEAKSESLKGIIDASKRTFAFTIPIQSFEGFNSPLQKVHFNENYLESQKFPNATFIGKVIEKIDFSEDGNYTIRAKGKLEIHGVVQERIIKSNVIVEGDRFSLHSNFTVILAEHDISVPKIVYQKIANEIQVEVKATFEKSEDE